MLATIQPTETGLHVRRGEYEWRRSGSKWEMLGNSGNWFESEIQDPLICRQIEDFEQCLRPYSIEEGPSYPSGRRKGESVNAFIRRKQAEELASATKGIFKPVSLHYDPHAAIRQRLAGHIRHVHSAPFDSKYLTTVAAGAPPRAPATCCRIAQGPARAPEHKTTTELDHIMPKRKTGMSTSAYNAIISRLGLSQIAAGKMLGLSPRQAQRVATGESPVPLPVAKLLRLIVQRKIKPEDVQ